MNDITIDGMEENDFRRSIEDMLRVGDADVAASKLRNLLGSYAGDDKILPSRFLTVSSDDIAISGWNELVDRIGRYDRPSHRISAVSIAIANPEGASAQPDASGCLAPRFETNYYSDGAFPFSGAARDDLLEGYSLYGSAWQGDFEESDAAISVEGLDDLYGAIVGLENRLLRSSQPNLDDICAGSLGACYVAVLIHLAVQRAIDRNGLPRPLCVMAGSNEVYPFFDAPVISSEECRKRGGAKCAANAAVNTLHADAETGDAASTASHDCTGLISIGPRTFKKRPVLVLDPAEAESASRHYELGGAQRMTDGGKPSNGSAPSGLEGIGLGSNAFANPGENGVDEEDDEEGEDELLDEVDDLWVPSDPADDDSEEAGISGLPDAIEFPALYSELPDDAMETELEPEGHFPPLAALHVVWETEDSIAPIEVDTPASPNSVADWEDASPGRECAEAGAGVAIEPEPATLVPGSARAGHGMRAAIVPSLEVRTTLGDRIAALFGHLREWLKRRGP